MLRSMIFILAVFIFSSCEEASVSPEDSEKLIGLWEHFELISFDRTIVARLHLDSSNAYVYELFLEGRSVYRETGWYGVYEEYLLCEVHFVQKTLVSPVTETRRPGFSFKVSYQFVDGRLFLDEGWPLTRGLTAYEKIIE